MKRGAALAIVALVLAAGVAGAMVLRRPAAPPAAIAAPAVEFLPGELWTAQPLVLARTLPLTGTLKAANQTIVKTRVAGDLVRLAVREGESVRAGQPLARIDPTEYEWRVKREQAALAAAQAQLDIAAKTRENNAQLRRRGRARTGAQGARRHRNPRTDRRHGRRALRPARREAAGRRTRAVARRSVVDRARSADSGRQHRVGRPRHAC
jgi:multidrug efflux pump subunit AcrA (membrane-fusion protein)